MTHYNISFAGAGKVADSLCNKMYSSGFLINLIVSPTEKRGRALAESCKAQWSEDYKFPDSTDIIIVAVPDHKLKEVLLNIKCRTDCLVVHTAGSFGLEIFPDSIKRKGVFYPLQTFSENRKIDFNGLPFLLEASDNELLDLLTIVAVKIGGKAYYVDAERRRLLHIAAVFTCNFTNHVLTLGQKIAFKSDFTLEILHPLLRETISKAIDQGPDKSQTGPAVRYDQNTMEKHLEILSFDPELQRIYAELTNSIIEYYKKS